MSELGSGSGSSYPGSLDTDASLEVSSPAAGKTKASANVPNDLASAIIAIETELGVDPAGSASTVVARLNTSLEADGSPKDTVIVTVSGSNQSISGHKVFASGIDTGIWGLKGTATVAVSGQAVVTESGAFIAHGGFGSESGVYLKKKIIEIGDWDMVASNSKSVPHTLTLANLRKVSVLIRDDNDADYWDFPSYHQSATTVEIIELNSTNVRMFRSDNGNFDSVSYDSTSYNRGWITIEYV